MQTSLIRSAVPNSCAVRLFAHLFIKNEGRKRGNQGENGKRGTREREKEGGRGREREESSKSIFLKTFSDDLVASRNSSICACLSLSLSLSPSLSFLLFYLFMSCAIERLLTRPPNHTRHVSSLHVLVILITFNVPCVSRRDSFVSHQKCDLCTPRRMRNIFWLNKNQTTQQPWPVSLCTRPKAL